VQRTLALHHRNPAEADRRWRGEEQRAGTVGSLFVATDALFADNVERKVSNTFAHFGRAGLFLDCTKRSSRPVKAIPAINV
jgi:hypothetical protein